MVSPSIPAIPALPVHRGAVPDRGAGADRRAPAGRREGGQAVNGEQGVADVFRGGEVAHRVGGHGGSGQFTRHVVLKQPDGYPVAQDFPDEGEGFAGGLPPGFGDLADVIAHFQRGQGFALPLPKGGQDVVFQNEAVAFQGGGGAVLLFVQPVGGEVGENAQAGTVGHAGIFPGRFLCFPFAGVGVNARL